MKVIDINFEKNNIINYKPLFIHKNYIYIIKEDFERKLIENEDDIKNSIYTGIYRYNIINNLLESAQVSGRITKYFYDNSKVYYVDIEESNKEYYVTFFEVDNNAEKKLVKIKLPGCIENDSLINVEARFEPFTLKDGIISYLYDICNILHDGAYNHLDDENQFKLFVYDSTEGKNYEVLDEKFSKNGFVKKVPFKFNDTKYLLLNAGLYQEHDKYEYLYDANKKNENDARGAKDSLYIIEIDKFVDEAKRGRKGILYKEIESIGQEGVVRFIEICGCKIFYKVTYFEKDYFELVIYNLSTDKYQRTKIESCDRLLRVTKSGKFVYLYNDENRTLIELSGEFFEKRRVVNIEGNVLGVIESKYIVSQAVGINEDKRDILCNIYDINSLNLVDRFKGKAVVFEEENIVVIY